MEGQYKIDITKVKLDSHGNMILIEAPGEGKQIILRDNMTYDIVEAEKTWTDINDEFHMASTNHKTFMEYLDEHYSVPTKKEKTIA